jgi:hypothetical protein
MKMATLKDALEQRPDRPESFLDWLGLAGGTVALVVCAMVFIP